MLKLKSFQEKCLGVSEEFFEEQKGTFPWPEQYTNNPQIGEKSLPICFCMTIYIVTLTQNGPSHTEMSP